MTWDSSKTVKAIMLCNFSNSRLALVKSLKPYRKNGEKALSLIKKINTKTKDFQAEYQLLYLENPAVVNKKSQFS